MLTGIITMFHNSVNYGGILQAYALIKALEGLGFKAEQIRYNNLSAYSLVRRLKAKIFNCLSIIREPWKINISLKIWKRSRIVINAAKELVPHSKKVYTEKNIHQCVFLYDSFITGSDQVWHGTWPAYFLPFVPSTLKKIAYAISTGKACLNNQDMERIKNYVNDFTAISVREIDTAEQLRKVLCHSGLDIEFVLDPTLLLSKKDWETVMSNRLIKENYIFCYFLASNVEMRKLSREYADKHGYVLVTIPHMQGRVENNDILFGDKESYEATPQDFLSYIKYSSAVFTDSFHACVFSHVFNKQFYVFGRSDHEEMNNRIVTLTSIFGTTQRFINEKKHYNLDYLEQIAKIKIDISSYVQLKEKSIKFIEASLKK